MKSTFHRSQLASLEQLQQQFAGSLLIIAFPTGAFGHENRTNSEIKAFCRQYGNGIILSESSLITGDCRNSVYRWLSNQEENGVMTGEITDEFQKYLISSSGQLVGVFSGVVASHDEILVSAIKESE